MAEGGRPSASRESRRREQSGNKEKEERVTKVGPEDYASDKKDYTAIKIICLGDSAVGKSK